MKTNNGRLVSINDTSINKVFYNHTSKFDIVKLGYAPKATIALQLTSAYQFIYGITICNEEDNFNKSVGREFAYSRMLKGFGIIDIPKTMEGKTNREKCLRMLYTLTQSVLQNPRKWRNKIQAFNEISVLERA